jgi:hypothetical protein
VPSAQGRVKLVPGTKSPCLITALAIVLVEAARITVAIATANETGRTNEPEFPFLHLG